MSLFSHSASPRTFKGEVRLLVLLLVLVLALYAGFLFDARSGLVSSEVNFADASPGGILVVPASCPSNPHYAGECGAGGGGGGGGGGDSDEPPPPGGNACIIALSPSTIVSGQSAFLGWSSTFEIFGIPFSMTGTISPTVGSVAGTGVTTVSPTQTTTYTGIFTPTGSVEGIPDSWLVPVSCVGTLTILQGQPGAGNCSQVRFCDGTLLYEQQTNCSNTFIQECPYGCSSGACLSPAPAAAYITATPLLVLAGEQTTVTWSSSNAASCSVSGTNGASWTGLSGSELSTIDAQTIFTLTCIGLDDTTVSRSVEVNIIPIFQEL